MSELVLVFLIGTVLMLILSSRWKGESLYRFLTMAASVLCLCSVLVDSTLSDNEFLILIVTSASLFFVSIARYIER